MKSFSTRRARLKIAALICLMFSLTLISSVETFAQKRKTKTRKVSAKTNIALPKVAQIDAAALGKLLKREGETAKPLLVNFWATWCEPCRAEFPELVKIDADYRGKIDFIVVSLDDLAEITRDVPKFLADVKSTMPAYLLKTEDEQAAIATISKNYQGGLPFTILFDAKGEIVYFKQGTVKPNFLRGEIDKVLSGAAVKQTE